MDFTFESKITTIDIYLQKICLRFENGNKEDVRGMWQVPNRKSSSRRRVSYDIIRLACYFQCLTFYAECIQPTNGKCSRSFLYSSNLTRGSAKRVRETVFICFSSFCRIPITSTYLRGILWESNSITYILLISICILCSPSLLIGIEVMYKACSTYLFLDTI